MSQKNNLLSSGIINILICAFYYSLVNVFVKKLSNLPSSEVALFRAAISLVICYYHIKRLNLSPWGNNKKLLLLRGTFGTISLILFFFTLQNMPLATAVTLQYLSSIFSTLLGGFILKESTNAIQWLFLIISFVGVVLIKGFETNVSYPYLFIGIVAAFTSSIAYNYLRMLKDYDHPILPVFYFALVSFPIILPYSVFNWVQPIGIDWLYLFLVGFLTQQGQIHMTKAFQSENLALVSNFNYVGIVFSLFFGYLFFSETVNLMSLFGIVLIIGSAIFSSRYKKTT